MRLARWQRGLALTLVIVLDFAIVAAHQLTPYMVIVQVGGLAVLGVVWRGWKLRVCDHPGRSSSCCLATA